MDPNQHPREETVSPALPRLSEAEFVRAVGAGFQTEVVKDDSPEGIKRNKARARDELSHIETLWQSSSFTWFFENCLEAAFKYERANLESPDVKPEYLERFHARFNAIRKIVRWLDEREIEHRRLDNPKDPKLVELRARLSLH